MADKVLIANRGEIACRVIRACREMGLGSVAIYSDADRQAVHPWLADEAVHVGPAPSRESYLRMDRVIDAARRTGARYVHPGYGFLSENAAFREACDDAGLVFVGPPADAMRKMGTKTTARDHMIAAGVPVVPGSDGPLASSEEALAVAQRIAYPVMVKAAAGGGGKGMRLVHDPGTLRSAFEGAAREAASAFGDATIYLEKAIVRPRHIEIQVLADRHGNCIHLFERECSVQRRNQKIIEESPASHLSQATRLAMGEVAVRAAKAVSYESAGTCEFLVDPEEHFYFLEMNTRLQVEHLVTELVTGLDLVVLQLRIAMGEPLPMRQEEIGQRGHAVECRIYAEDPAAGFLPSPGPLHVYRTPKGPGVRVDDGVIEGGRVPSDYDPMIAKLAVWSETRGQAIDRSLRALHEYEIVGVSTNRTHLEQILRSEAFRAGPYDTGLVASLPPLPAKAPGDPLAMGVAALLYARETVHKEASRSSAAGWKSFALQRAVERF